MKIFFIFVIFCSIYCAFGFWGSAKRNIDYNFNKVINSLDVLADRMLLELKDILDSEKENLPSLMKNVVSVLFECVFGESLDPKFTEKYPNLDSRNGINIIYDSIDDHFSGILNETITSILLISTAFLEGKPLNEIEGIEELISCDAELYQRLLVLQETVLKINSMIQREVEKLFDRLQCNILGASTDVKPFIDELLPLDNHPCAKMINKFDMRYFVDYINLYEVTKCRLYYDVDKSWENALKVSPEYYFRLLSNQYRVIRIIQCNLIVGEISYEYEFFREQEKEILNSLTVFKELSKRSNSTQELGIEIPFDIKTYFSIPEAISKIVDLINSVFDKSSIVFQLVLDNFIFSLVILGVCCLIVAIIVTFLGSSICCCNLSICFMCCKAFRSRHQTCEIN